MKGYFTLSIFPIPIAPVHASPLLRFAGSFFSLFLSPSGSLGLDLTVSNWLNYWGWGKWLLTVMSLVPLEASGGTREKEITASEKEVSKTKALAH